MPDEKPVSLSPLNLGDALKGLLAIPDPEKPNRFESPNAKRPRHPLRSERGPCYMYSVEYV